ncbi:MAG: hypothetical protein CML68_13630 [Rhodobacteraceae bacterium]|nr:hypothetical protein [Paracoccaceae bacterium]
MTSPSAEEIRDLYNEGMSSVEIGRMYGVCDSAIRSKAIRHGIPRPGSREKSVRQIAEDMSPQDAVDYLLGVVEELQEALIDGGDEVDRIGVHFTGYERRLMARLMKSAGGMVTRDALFSAIYYDRPNPDDMPDRKIVDAFVCKTRKKLPAEVGSIENVWGREYRFVAAPGWDEA